MIDARFRNIDGPDKPRPVEAMNDARLWHPWLRINRVLRVMLHTHWSAEAWSQVRVEFRRALALRSEIRRAGWEDDRSYLLNVMSLLRITLVIVRRNRSGAACTKDSSSQVADVPSNSSRTSGRYRIREPMKNIVR